MSGAKMKQLTFFGYPERNRSWRNLLPLGLLLSIELALYGVTLFYGFVWDDEVYVRQNFRVQGLSYAHLRAIWTSTYLGHYAPVHHTFLALLHHFSGLEPFGYHLGQLLLHAACVCLLYFILAKIESPRIAFLCGLLFVVHPTNIETVAWISETKSTLAFFFFLLSFWMFLRFREKDHIRDFILCCAFLLLSILAKINTVVAPAIFFLYDYWQSRSSRRNIWSYCSLFLVCAVFVAVHLRAFHGSSVTMESSYYGGFGVHVLNLPFLLLFYLGITVFPRGLTAWHMLPIYENLNLPVTAAWLMLALLAWLFFRIDRRTQFWTMWFPIFLAPVLQIVPFPIWVAERYLYIPAIGLFVLGSRAFFYLADRSGPMFRLSWEAAMAGVLLLLAWQTRGHIPVWQNDRVLWEATAKTCPTSPYCHSNLGMTLLQRGDLERGVKELIRAVELRPAPEYLENLGDAYTLSLGDYRQALVAYSMAFQEGDRSLRPELGAKLARVYIKTGKLDLAQQAIQSGAEVDANNPTLLVMNGFLQWKLGNNPAALSSLRQALRVTGQSSNPSAFIGRIWGDPAEVGRLIAELRSTPAHLPAVSPTSSGPTTKK